MKYLLDTNILISMFKNQHGVREKIISVGFDSCFVSELTLAELYVGAYKGRNPKQLKEVEFVKSNFQIIPDSIAIERYAKVRAELELSGNVIDSIDCLIGSTALECGFTMVTNNRKHFERIPNIKIEDWQK